MTSWERLQFEDFKRMIDNSPTLNISKKRMFERMLEDMERIWMSKEVI